MNCLYAVFVKSSDILMFGETVIEVKMEILKTHEFLPWRKVVSLSCDRQEDGSNANDQP